MWQERKDLAENGATYIEGFARFGDLQTHIFCVYKPLGKVVGLMFWNHSLMFWNHRYRQGQGVVPILVMLPGRESEGTFLVEYAVKLSETAGYQGRTCFEFFNDERLRYEPSWVEYLQSANVVPHDESDEWVKIDGAWRLRKNFRHLTTKPARKVQNPDL